MKDVAKHNTTLISMLNRSLWCLYVYSITDESSLQSLEVASLMRSFLSIFPDGFLGMLETKATLLILLYGATCCVTKP